MKMKPANKSIPPILTVLILNVVFFVENHYPRHILEYSSIWSLIPVAFNLLYFFFYYYFLVALFSQNKSPFDALIFIRGVPLKYNIEVQKFAVLFLIQIVFDGILMLLDNAAIELRYLGGSLLVAIHWCLIFIVLVGFNSSIWKKRTMIIYGFSAVAALLLLSAVADVSLIVDYKELTPKYHEGAPLLSAVQMNVEFIYEIKSFVFDTLIGVALVLLYFLGGDNEEIDKDLKPKRAAISFLRLGIIFSGAIIAMVFKYAVWPDATLMVPLAGSSSWKSTNFQEWGIFNTQGESVAAYRFSREANDFKECYQKYVVYVFRDNIKPVSFSQPTRDAIYPQIIEDKNVSKAEGFKVFFKDNVRAYLYEAQLICYYEEDGTPGIVRLEDIKDMDAAHPAVTYVCKKLLSDGNVFVFEYACEYLYKYDNEFITPYIQRFSEGNFTDMERVWMDVCYYRSEYVIKFANDFAT